MPFDLIFLVSVLGAALGIGYWCYFIWQRKRRPPWTGFVLGFLLSFYLTPLAGLVGVGLSYRMAGRDAASAQGRGAKVVFGILLGVTIVVVFSVVVQVVLAP